MNNDGLTLEEEEEVGTGVLHYIFKILRYWHWIALALIVSFTYAYIYLKKYIPIYKVNATILIKDDKKLNDNILNKLSMNNKNKLVENEIEVLKSRALAGKVIDDLNLTVSYWREDKFRDTELHTNSPFIVKNTSPTDLAYISPVYIKMVSDSTYQLQDIEKIALGVYNFGKPIKTKYGQLNVSIRDSVINKRQEFTKVTFYDRDNLVQGFISGLQVSLLNPQSSLILLSLESPIPKKGKDILKKLLDEYSTTALQDKNREATNTLRFIEERLKLITTELGDVEHNIENYRKTQGVVDLSDEANSFLKKVEDNDSKINEIDIQLKLLDVVDEYLTSPQVGVITPATMMGANDNVLNSYITKLSDLEVERSKLAQTVQAGNPSLETLNAQIRSTKQAMKETLDKQRGILRASRANLVGINAGFENALSAIPRKERLFVGIKRQANIKEDLYLLLLKTREETSLSYASTVTDSRVVDEPYATKLPVRPNTGTVYLIALLLGLIVPITYIVVKESLTNTVQSKKEIEKKVGIKVFGEVGLQPKEKKGEIIDIRSRSFVSEQVRMLRSNMRYLFLDTHDSIGKTIMVTSSISGEGKSFMTLNIAASLALLGKKVVILGMDLRKPKIHEYLQANNSTGMSNYLIGQLGLSDIIQLTNIENLYIIPSGPTPPNPSELISKGRIKELIATLRQPFDYIVIDTPPLGLVTDAILLEPCTDVCFYLVRHEKTPVLYLNTIKDLVDKKVFKSMNIIFNAVNYKNSSTYGYGYGYAKGDYYTEDDKKSWIGKLVSKES
ncbi:polysaccharide biosynthesis tyrosine autokinase [Spirosoma harenae]